MYDYPIDKAVVLEAIKQIDQGIDEGVSYGLPEFLNHALGQQYCHRDLHSERVANSSEFMRNNTKWF